MAQLAAVPVVVKSVAALQASPPDADDGAFEQLLAALTPNLAAPQAPAVLPLPQAKDAKPAPAAEPAPVKDAKTIDVAKLLPRPAAAADIKLAKTVAMKPDAEQIEKPAAPPSTDDDDKEPVAVAPMRPVPTVGAKPEPDKIAADVVRPPVQAPVQAPAIEAPKAAEVPAELVEAAVQAAAPAAKPQSETKPDAKTQPEGKPAVVVDRTPRTAPQPIVQDATPAQEVERDAPPPQPAEASVNEQSVPKAQPSQPAHQPAQAATAAVTHLLTSVSASTPVHAAVPAHTPEPALPEPQPNLKALAAQIVAKAAAGTKSFEIRLDPPELGRVEVRLTVSHDGKAEATLTAERPETVALLQRDSQNLERTLKEAGLDVSNSSLNFSLKGEQQGQGDGGGASGAHARSLSHAVVARSEAVNASLANQHRALADGRLDIFV